MGNIDRNLDDTQLEEVHYIGNLDTLKVMTDERRLQMLELLVQQPYTVKQLAGELELAPTKLYYHIKQLEDHELIRVVETQVVSGIIEKTYRARARRFSIDETVLQPNKDTVQAAVNMVSTMFENTLQEIRRSADGGLMLTDDDEHTFFNGEVGKHHFALTKDQAEAFRERYMELIDEFKVLENETDPEQPREEYGLLIAYFPMIKSTRHDSDNSTDE